MARIQDLDIQALLESHVSQMGYVQPICLSTQDSYAEEEKKTESEQIDCGLTNACLSIVKVKRRLWNVMEGFMLLHIRKLSFILRPKNMELQKKQFMENRAEQLLPNNLEINGTLWKKSGSSTAKNDNEKETQYSGSGCIGESFSTVMRNQNYGPSNEASSMEPETALDGITKFLYAIRKAKNKT
ncbi:hypothetical protein AQUCO_04700094v1 [Aquilegia coerulea]|uniref:Uncharacterized protein n=1 Tax=Aquilegia coerulea TaxID=218851 RepID=A0A2G5CL20_AQUCA|nr:hypothetical protein AQUCO_04700094v1 [Aquilegia coerulea]